MILELHAVDAPVNAVQKGELAESEPKSPQQTQSQEQLIKERVARDAVECASLKPPKSPGRKLRLLSLDGGGVRGLLSLLLLQRIMEEVSRQLRREIKPCDYFDLIGGTSTGGLIAIMLGRLKMSVDECIKAYTNLSKEIFDVNWFGQSMGLVLKGGRFDGDKLRDAINRVVESKIEDDTMAERDTGDICRTFVVANHAMDLELSPKLFRSYDNVPRKARADRCRIWEAGRATACAPTFFSSVEIDGIFYLDGGLRYNNPSQLVLDEAKSLWGDRAEIGCLISLGTGLVRGDTARLDSVRDLAALARVFKRLVTGCQGKHLDIETSFRTTYSREGKYYRFNVGLEQKIELYQWDKIDDMQVAALGYIKEQAEKFDGCAEHIWQGLDREPYIKIFGEWAVSRYFKCFST